MLFCFFIYDKINFSLNKKEVNLMKIVILLFVVYLLGLIFLGVWIGKFFFKKDIC